MNRWAPLTPPELHSELRGFPGPWYAGGIAIERAVGSTVRTHGDIDILVLRRDAALLRSHLKQWIIRESDTGTRLWCRPTKSDAWSFEMLLDEANGDAWVSRRCSYVTRPLSELGWTTPTGIPVLAPEIVLFYKAKTSTERDNTDFNAMLPRLGPKARTWLSEAIGRIDLDHPWRRRLAETVTWRRLEQGAEYGAEDVTSITKLLHDAYAPLGTAGMNYSAVYQGESETLRRLRRGIALIGVIRDQIIATGTVYLEPVRGISVTYRALDTAHFGQFAVAPALQGTGIGSDLLSRLEAIAKQAGKNDAPQFAALLAAALTSLVPTPFLQLDGSTKRPSRSAFASERRKTTVNPYTRSDPRRRRPTFEYLL